MSHLGRTYLIENWLGHLEVFEGSKRELAAVLDPGDDIISTHNSRRAALEAGKKMRAAWPPFRKSLDPTPSPG